jgi:hypothetical protein
MPVQLYSEQHGTPGDVITYKGTPEQLREEIAPARYWVALMLQTAKLKHERLRHVKGISLAALEAKIEFETIEEVLHAIHDLPNLVQ